MGFLSGIGNAFKNVAKTVGDVAGKVASFAGKAVKILQAPQEAISGFVKKAAGGLLDKLPFGLGKVAKPFVDKLVDHGLSFLAKGPLAGIFTAATKLAPTVKDIADIAETVSSAAKKVGAFEIPESLENAQEIFSFAHAQKLLEN
ncbi:hypothetical protein P2318_34075 [Myxococcaceae bacterium GXIMD 01537]